MYWQDRYAAGGTSGAGSYGQLSAFKAQFVNDYVAQHEIDSVLELGCGDGNQLLLARYPSYVGVDISPIAIMHCQEKFIDDKSKRFIISGSAEVPQCELGISLDVIYHLVEDEVFEAYMRSLLDHSKRAVILYTSDSDVFQPCRREPSHIRHRPVGRWMSAQRDWKFIERRKNAYPYHQGAEDTTSFADFYIYERITTVNTDADGQPRTQ